MNQPNPFRFRSVVQGRLILSAEGKWLQKTDTEEGIFWLTPTAHYDRDGYEYVLTSGKKYYTHQEVALHFLPVPVDLDDPVVHHKDENKKNNSITNLEWMSRSTHSSHHKTGEENHNAKLTWDGVAFIRLAKSSLPAKELAKMFNVSEPTIYNIWSKRIWNPDRREKNDSQKSGMFQD